MRIAASSPYRRLRFQPTVLARDLAASVEGLSAAIHAVHTNRLDGSEAERLVGVRGVGVAGDGLQDHRASAGGNGPPG